MKELANEQRKDSNDKNSQSFSNDTDTDTLDKAIDIASTKIYVQEHSISYLQK